MVASADDPTPGLLGAYPSPLPSFRQYTLAPRRTSVARVATQVAAAGSSSVPELRGRGHASLEAGSATTISEAKRFGPAAPSRMFRAVGSREAVVEASLRIVGCCRLLTNR